MATEIKSARDALEKIEKLAHCDLCNVYPKYRAKFDAKIGGIERIAKAALALPRRNCEVGTAEERMFRYHALRREITERYERIGEHNPPSFAYPTAFEWEDMPYEEGAADGN